MRHSQMFVKSGSSKIFFTAGATLEARVFLRTVHQHVRMKLELFLEHVITTRKGAYKNSTAVMDERVSSQILVPNKL